MKKADVRLLGKVSKLYYEARLTQEEIMARMGLSQAKVSRLLQQARDEGIISIKVNPLPGNFPDLEIKLEERYHLQEAVVVEVSDGQNGESVAQELGLAAAEYFEQTVAPGDIVGITWGRTLNHMVSAIRSAHMPGVEVVQVLGGLGRPESNAHAIDLARRLSRSMGSRLTLLPAPGIVDSQQVKAVMLSDTHIQHAFERFAHLSTVLVGIGAPTPDSLLIQDGSILKERELVALVNQGAVGDIALQFIDRQGKRVESDIHARVLGITLEQLGGIPRVVAVAGGKGKEQAIRGALLSGVVRVLVVDHITAAWLADVISG